MSGAARPVLAVALAACVGCPGPPARIADSAGMPAASASAAASLGDQVIYDGAGAGLANGWQESGSVARELGGGPAKIHFNEGGEWVLIHPGLDAPSGWLTFQVKEPPGEGEFLEIRAASKDGRTFQGVKVKPEHCTNAADGWKQVRISMREINPDGVTLDRIVLKTFRPLVGEEILFDKIALTKEGPASTAGGSGQGPTAPARSARARVQCLAKATKISPFIYGVAQGDDEWTRFGATARRWGGNPNSRYNWERHFNSSASDWFFENHPSKPYTDFLAENGAREASSALTIPMLGWAAKDGTSYSFPVAVFGRQRKTDPSRPDAGDGVAPSGVNLTPGSPTTTSIEAPPDWVKRWVSTIRAEDAKSGKRSVAQYILDNEPMLWHATHRDLHPRPVGYDELLDRTVRYGSAIRQADPEATIAGPAEWGWPAYFDSAQDQETHGHADRVAHQNVPLAEWYLRKLRDYEQRTGTCILDVFDLHYYPQEANVYGGGAGGADRATQLLRLRSTRSLWDPTYVDESWIHEPIRLLPRMREWVDRNYPGRAISLGEWNFGGEKDVTGALATAEALGRFAQFGVTSAFYWTSPPQGSPSVFGFLAYRNFDGKGGHFQDWYVPATPLDGATLFVSRDTDGKHLVIVAINLLPDTPIDAELDLGACGTVASQQAYVYSDGAAGFASAQPARGAAGGVKQLLPAWSITVIDAHLR